MHCKQVLTSVNSIALTGQIEWGIVVRERNDRPDAIFDARVDQVIIMLQACSVDWAADVTERYDACPGDRERVVGNPDGGEASNVLLVEPVVHVSDLSVSQACRVGQCSIDVYVARTSTSLSGTALNLECTSSDTPEEVSR